MATVGRHAAVVELSGGFTITGPLAWLIWVFMHIAKLIGFRNQLMVFVTWVYNYFNGASRSRLILGGTAIRPAGVLRTVQWDASSN